MIYFVNFPLFNFNRILKFHIRLLIQDTFLALCGDVKRKHP
jgi:hypothetical protein